ncbi:hypothetical protein M9H77_16315 [Catharanthus roseus]|uniref:Uncharacterized protein n=1 Tax=Catharanthus roseus TaxID=4058 RepID=A0ACC0B1E4_CATRO|nr:hypothetical protein M9H77_16315 [Catharanthus roseus]
MKLDAEKWTLLHDGGHRHGIMTTNIFEELNSVLKKATVLPLIALVELIFNKLVKYFHQQHEEAENCVHPFPTRIFDNCGKWQTYALACSHVLAVCRETGSRTDAYVLEIYSRQTYIKTYEANFHLVLSENFWRDVSFNLTFYPPNMKKKRGRKQGKRFQGEMDYRNLDSKMW